MKKHWLYSLAVAAAVGMTACSADEMPGPNLSGQEVTVSFSAAIPAEMNTRAISDGTTAKNLYYAVYEAGSKTPLIYKTESEKSDNAEEPVFDGLKTELELKLITGKTYDIVFFAAADGAPYTLNLEDQTMTVDYENALANDEKRDAFWGVRKSYKVEGSGTEQVALTRPFAQVNVGTTDYDAAVALGVEYTTSQLKVNGVYSTMSLLDAGITETTTTDVTFGYADLPVADELFPKDEGAATRQYRYMTAVYVLVPADQITVDCEVGFKTAAGVERTISVPNAPVQRNFRTNIYGQLLTSTTNWNIEITPGYLKPDHEIPIWTGKIEQPVIPDEGETDKIVNINSAEELAGLAQIVNGGKSLYGYEIKLNSDLDLGNAPWTPIGSDLGNTFLGTFDGQGHTIYNLVAKGEEYVGLFGSAGNDPGWHKDIPAVIKDVKIKNANVSGCHFVGALAGHLSLSLNGSVTGCEVDGANVSGHWNSELKEDGNAIGAMFGHLQADKGTVTGNKVLNSSVSGIRKVGGLTGSLSAGTYPIAAYTDNSVSNTTITIVPDNHDKGNYAFGEIVGLNDAKGFDSESGNTATSVNIISPAWDGMVMDPHKVDNTYEVWTAAQLAGVAKQVNDGTERYSGKTIKLMMDINLNEKLWTPIGNVGGATNGFSGTFDGQNHTVSNLKIDIREQPGLKNAALFGLHNNAKISNLSVKGVNIYAVVENQPSYKIRAAAIAAHYIVDITNCHVENFRIEGNCHAGGIAGGQIYGIIDGCTSKDGEIILHPNKENNAYDNGDKAGGICGQIAEDPKCVITDCTVDGVHITGVRDLGGIAGMVGNNESSEKTISGNHVSNVTITRSSSPLEKNENYGAIVGRIDNKVILSGNTADNVTFVNCEATNNLK